MTNGEGPAGGNELPELARSCEVGGIQVTVRAFLVRDPRPRYELVLNGDGQTAIVDVPADEADTLEDRVEQALSGFAAAIAVRAECDGS